MQSTNIKNLAKNLGKLGIVGVLLAAICSPCCFPFFAFGASLLGLGSFELFGGWTICFFQAMVLMLMGGLFISYRTHRCMYPLIVTISSSFLIFYAAYFIDQVQSIYLFYTGIIGLFLATIWNYQRNKIHGTCSNNIELESTITCPNCQHQKMEIMPTDACVYFYECEHCKTRLKPLQGDCCVYCSYGTVKCPPIQAGENCCA